MRRVRPQRYGNLPAFSRRQLMRALVGLGITVISNPSKMPWAHAATEMVEDRTAEIFDAPGGFSPVVAC
jgi:hypothetical protein